MQTGADHSHLALARAKFEPVARVLDQLARDIAKDHGQPVVLAQRGPMQQTAQNAYAVRYSLRHSDEVRLSLTFIIAGEEADLILIQDDEHSGPQDIRANPGQVDQHVYRVEKIEEVQEAVREKIIAHLERQAEEGKPQIAKVIAFPARSTPSRERLRVRCRTFPPERAEIRLP